MSNDVDILEEGQSSFVSRKVFGEPRVPGFTKFLIKSKLVKTTKQSYYLMLGFTVVALLVTAYIVGYYVFNIGNPVQNTYVFPEAFKYQMNIR